MENNITPEVEKLEVATKPELSPSEKASYEFAVSIKPFKKSLHSMGKKELIRVLSWLVEHPLQDDNFKFKSNKESNLANLAFYLLTRKLVIVRDGLNGQQPKNDVVSNNNIEEIKQEGEVNEKGI